MDWSAAIAHLQEVDPKLAPLIAKHGPPTIKAGREPVHALAKAIVSQQLSTQAAATIFGRFLDLYPKRRFPTVGQLLATPDDKLRAAGLSGAKRAAIKDLARHVMEKRFVPAQLLTLTDAEVAAALLPIRGIGPWSVDMFMMFSLARPDVLPVGDLGIRKGMRQHFKLRSLPEPARMTKLAAPWAPFRTVASWYMWRLLET